MVFGNFRILVLTLPMKLLRCSCLVMYTKSTGRQQKEVLWLYLMHLSSQLKRYTLPFIETSDFDGLFL